MKHTFLFLEGNWVAKGDYFDDNRITPLDGRTKITHSKSYNPALGTLIGEFMVAGDTIMSVYTSENGEYSGLECLTQVSDSAYKGRGFAFKE